MMAAKMNKEKFNSIVWFLLWVLFCIWSITTAIEQELSYNYDLPLICFTGFKQRVRDILTGLYILMPIICAGLLALIVLKKKRKAIVPILCFLLLCVLSYMVFVYCEYRVIIDTPVEENAQIEACVSALNHFILGNIVLYLAIAFLFAVSSAIQLRAKDIPERDRRYSCTGKILFAALIIASVFFCGSLIVSLSGAYDSYSRTVIVSQETSLGHFSIISTSGDPFLPDKWEYYIDDTRLKKTPAYSHNHTDTLTIEGRQLYLCVGCDEKGDVTCTLTEDD